MTETTRVDLFIDPVCPFTWVASQWLREVENHRRLDLRFHLMSLLMLNEHRPIDAQYRALLTVTARPSRVAAAAVHEYGEGVLRPLTVAFGEQFFGNDGGFGPPRTPPAEFGGIADRAIAAALDQVQLPMRLMDVAGTDVEVALRRSHEAAVDQIGPGGTPIVHLDGVAVFGPVLMAAPRGEAAARVFDGVRMLTGCAGFVELKRTSSSLPGAA